MAELDSGQAVLEPVAHDQEQQQQCLGFFRPPAPAPVLPRDEMLQVVSPCPHEVCFRRREAEAPLEIVDRPSPPGRDWESGLSLL